MKKTTDELVELLCEIEVAADDYYADMDDDEFEEEFEAFLDSDDDAADGEDPEEIVDRLRGRSYFRQREIGFDAYREEVGAKIAAIGDAEDLHVLAACVASNAPAWTTTVIGLHPACDVLTARLLYWDRAPHQVHGGPRGGGGDWDAEAVAALEDRARTIGFPEGIDLAFMEELADDPGEVLEIARPDYDGHLAVMKPKLDYSAEPYSSIPAVFR